MNLLIKALLLSFLVIVFVSCAITRPVATSTPENNKNYQIDYLFEHERCKVYRFNDMGNYVYFTNCTGDVTSIENDSTKARVINKIKYQPSK